MTEEEHEHDENCLVQFQWADPGEDGLLHIVAWIGKARLHIDYVDSTREGQEDLGRIIHTMPQIISHIRQEQAIKREVDSVDQDLLDLLGEGEV